MSLITHSLRVATNLLQQENGVQNAIQAIYRDLEYAKTLIKVRISSKDAASNVHHHDDHAADIEESWTFIGDESDPELQKRIRDWDPTAYRESRASMDLVRPKAIGAVRPSSLAEKGSR